MASAPLSSPTVAPSASASDTTDATSSDTSSGTSSGTSSWPLHAAGPGALAGLAGGVPFGVMMAVMGMLPMVAALVGASSPVIGFVVHLGISATIGAPLGVAAVRWTETRAGTLALSIANGVLWWALGALLLMPIGLGMPERILTIGVPQGISLVGHLVFGVVSGLAFNRIWR